MTTSDKSKVDRHIGNGSYRKDLPKERLPKVREMNERAETQERSRPSSNSGNDNLNLEDILSSFRDQIKILMERQVDEIKAAVESNTQRIDQLFSYIKCKKDKMS